MRSCENFEILDKYLKPIASRSQCQQKNPSENCKTNEKEWENEENNDFSQLVKANLEVSSIFKVSS